MALKALAQRLRAPVRGMGPKIAPPDPVPNPAHDLIVDGFAELTQRLGV